MTEPVIQVRKLSKEYHIGSLQQRYDRLSDLVMDTLKTPFRRTMKILRGVSRSAAELDTTIWALKDVDFDIRQGEVVGIIGRNGAGKSTLLKILSRITEPTEGYADIFGRVGSLLEVGTGFHQELTGRENIYLNGAILGMRRAEVRRKFDEIVAFSDIEKFIDTPVKHYSSGMYVRLAFAVAAHLDPEILLVDEVLAVGDIEFQKKCLGKMDEVAHTGRTVVFVSHNMGLIQTLCQRGIFLDEGEVVTDAPIDVAVSAYLDSLTKREKFNLAERTDRRGKGMSRLVGLEILNGDGKSSILSTGQPVLFKFRVDRMMAGMVCNFVIFDFLGRPIVSFKSSAHSPEDVQDPDLEGEFICEMDKLLLLPGSYRIDVAIRGGGDLQDMIQAAAMIDVIEGPLDGRAIRARQSVHVAMPHRWRTPINN